MNRTKLSSDQVFVKIVLVLAYISGIIFIIVNSINLLALFFITVVFVFIAYSRFFSSDKIEFDDDKMYVVYKDGETQVDLKDVYYVTRQSVLSNGLGRIKYHFEGDDYYAQFYPRYLSSSLKDFKKAVAKKNPNFKDGDYWNPFYNNPY